jgi:hypothetical protein
MTGLFILALVGVVVFLILIEPKRPDLEEKYNPNFKDYDENK